MKWFLPRWWLYRPIMRLAHRYNWHHTTKCGPFEDGSTQHWCQWCGLRHSTPPIDYAGRVAVLKPSKPTAEQP